MQHVPREEPGHLPDAVASDRAIPPVLMARSRAGSPFSYDNWPEAA